MAFCSPMLPYMTSYLNLLQVYLCVEDLDLGFFYYTQGKGFPLANANACLSVSIHQVSNIWSSQCLGLYLTLPGMHLIKGVTKAILEEVTMIKEKTVHSNFIFLINPLT